MAAVETGIARGEATYTLTLSPEANDLLLDLAQESGEPGGELIGKALALLKLAMEARKQGKRIGIAGAGQHLETEIDLS